MTETKVAKGKISYICEDGWGFILSKDVPFTRIFFHWTGLRQDTLNFKEIEEGMTVEFVPVTSRDNKVRAIKIKIIEPEMKEKVNAN